MFSIKSHRILFDRLKNIWQTSLIEWWTKSCKSDRIKKNKQINQNWYFIRSVYCKTQVGHKHQSTTSMSQHNRTDFFPLIYQQKKKEITNFSNFKFNCWTLILKLLKMIFVYSAQEVKKKHKIEKCQLQIDNNRHFK